MDNNRRRDGRTEHNSNERELTQQTRNDLPTGFEGMNFEQQRGSYQNAPGIAGRPDDGSDRISLRDERLR